MKLQINAHFYESKDMFEDCQWQKQRSVPMKSQALGAAVDTATYEHGCVTICSD